MAGPFPLDGAFASLRREVESVIAAVALFRESLATGATAAGAATASAAKNVGQLGASQDRAARSSVRLRDTLRDVSGATSGLQRVIKGGGDLAKLFGFEEAGRRAEDLAKGIGAVKDVVSGIVAAGPALASISSFIGVVLGGIGAIQEGVRQATGETLSLKNTVAGAALAVADVINQSVSGWKLAFNDLALFVQDTFASIGRAILRPILEALVSLGTAMQRLGMDLQKSANPALVATGNTLRDLARGAISASDVIEGAYDRMGDAATQAAQENKVANDAILEDVKTTSEGIEVQINKLFDEPEGKSLFRDPFGALGELLPTAPGAAAGPTGGGATSAGMQTGVDYVSGLSEAMQQGAPQINEELLQALTVDPDDGEVISSFKDLWKNIGKVFSSNPIGFLGGLFGSSGVGGGGVGFAHGGKIGRGGSASLAHMFARGFARGGRPGGLDPRDTVPIWAQPGEWVIRAGAAAKYGARAMQAINAGLLDSGAIQALAGGVGVGPGVRHSSAGYASGGAVSAGGGGAGGGPQVMPMAVVDQETADMITSMGKNAILRLFNEDPDFRGFRP